MNPPDKQHLQITGSNIIFTRVLIFVIDIWPAILNCIASYTHLTT